MEKEPVAGLCAEDIAHYQNLASQYAKKSLLPIFQGEYSDGNLELLPEKLKTAFEIGIAASPDESLSGCQYGIWGSATEETGIIPSLLILSVIAETCGGVAMSLHAQGVASNLLLQAKRKLTFTPVKVGVGLQEEFCPPFLGTIISPDKDNPAKIMTTAEQKGNNYIINGSKSFVYSMSGVDAYVVFARVSEKWGCFLVSTKEKGMERTDVGVRTGLRACCVEHVKFNNVEMSIWEHDTKTLSWGVRRWRRKALKFAREYIRPLAPEADLHPHDYDPQPILSAAARQGFQTLLLVPPFGTASTLSYYKNTVFQVAVVGEEFATECGGLTLLLLAHNLGIAPLLLSGSLRNILGQMIPFYLKSYILGRPECMAFAITEPGAGSDVEETEGGALAKLVTTAKSVPDQGGYILNGRKCFISDGAIADKVTVFAKLENEGIESWTCFLVERGMKGFSVGRSERKMGQRASDASELIFDNVFIPKKNIVGKLRSGWAINRNVLNYSRPVVGAMALGHGRGAFERSLEFCRKTNLGPKRLIAYQDVQLELADMAISLWAARSMIWHSCGQFRSYQSVSASAKVFASDTAFKVCNQAMELMGDHGYLHAHGVERAWRDSRLTQIYEGTNQINRLALFEHHLSTDFKI